MKVGIYDAKAILTGSFALDGGAMFGTVPKVLWNKTNPADEKNRIAMEARCLLLISEERKILVDVGLGERLKEKYGEKFAQKFEEMYKLDRSRHSIEKSLAQYGLKYDDITDVILTHLHFDHAGGATLWRDGKLTPTFPKARYYVQRRNLELAKKPNLREKASYFRENFEALLEAGCLNLLDGNVREFLPQIEIFVTFGHTEAQQLVRVGTDKKGDNIVYGGDIIPTSTHVRLPFVMGYDLHPLEIMAEKEKILNRLADDGGLLFFEHDPTVDAARIRREPPDFAVAEKVKCS